MADSERIFRSLMLLIVILTIPFFMNIITLSVEGGFTWDAFVDKSGLYLSFLSVASLILLIGIIAKKKFPDILQNWDVFNPRDSPMGKIPFLLNLIKTPVRMYLLFILIMIPIVSIGVQTNSFFAEPNPLFSQAITKTGDFLGGTYPGAVAETLTLIVFFYFLLLINNYLYKKGIYPKDARDLLIFMIVLIGGVIWWLFHTVVYGSDQVAGLVTFAFGTVGLAITILTGSIVGFIVIHDINNLASKANELFSDQSTFIVMGIVWVLILALYIYILTRRR